MLLIHVAERDDVLAQAGNRLVIVRPAAPHAHQGNVQGFREVPASKERRHGQSPGAETASVCENRRRVTRDVAGQAVEYEDRFIGTAPERTRVGGTRSWALGKRNLLSAWADGHSVRKSLPERDTRESDAWLRCRVPCACVTSVSPGADVSRPTRQEGVDSASL